MSASLVGSEMCIRDSVEGGRSNSIITPARLAAWSAFMRSWRRSLGAVSYTHLTLPTICSV
eukprot:15131958-Alexandrium_andersonii.AAC.1